MSGFDWLQVSSGNTSGSVLPAPRVSFNGSGNDSPRPIPTHQQGLPYQQHQANGGLGVNYNSQSMLNIPQSTQQSHPQQQGDLGQYLSLSNLNLTSRNHAASFSTSPNSNESIPGTGSGVTATNTNPSVGDYTEDDSSIPLSLQTQELTFQELKTYMRWYSDILARTNARTISMQDVYSFLSNFKIPESVKEKINKIYSKILYSINIGEFFALLRLISHTLSGLEPSRRLIKIQAPTPKPPSILSKKRPTEEADHEVDEDDLEESSSQSNNHNNFNNNSNTNNGNVSNSNGGSAQLDLDSFTQFMLTGERPEEQRKKKRSKKLKSVKFSDQIVTDVHDVDTGITSLTSPSPQPQQDIDYSLPMDQLLGRLKQSQSVEEKEILQDMEEQINHFQGLNSVDKTSQSYDQEHQNQQLLRPNMTGPAQMQRYFSPSPEPQLQSLQDEYLQPNMTGPAQMARLQPNRTGPADMARLFTPDNNDQPKISLQSFTNQMTGNTFSNTMQNSKTSVTGSPSQPSDINNNYNNINNNSNGHSSEVLNNYNNNRTLPPPPIPQNRRARSATSPTPVSASLLYDTNNNNIPHTNNGFLSAGPPVPPRNGMSSPLSGASSPQPSGRAVPPPPPPSRRRTASATTSPLHYHQRSVYNNNNNNNKIIK